MGTVKYTGPVASFHCPTNAEIRSLKVHFSPKQEGTGDPSPENVREIVGWDGVEVYRNDSTTNYEFGVLGKNKFDAANWQNDNSSITYISANSFSIYTSAYIEQHNAYSIQNTKGLDRVLSFKATTNSLTDSRASVSIQVTKNNGTTLVTSLLLKLMEQDYEATYTLSIPAECDTIKFTNWAYNGQLTLSNVQLELGSTATTYEPYDPKHTVYGGWVDLISGEVCEEWINFPFTSSLNWNKAGRSSSGVYFYYENNKAGEQCLWTAGQYNKINAQEKYTHGKVENPWSEVGNNAWAYSATTNTIIRLSYSDDMNILSVDDLKDWLDEQGNVSICYPLATPNAYHIAPTSLQTFLGHNNVWSNADYVEVEYDLHETQTLLQRKAFIMANQPHIIKPAAAALQNFKTDVIAPLKECKVHFSPVQDLHGYSNPWPAGGGKNLFNINAAEQNPDNTALSNSSARKFITNTYAKGASYSNYWQSGQIFEFVVNNNSITVSASTGYGVGFPIKMIGNTTYFISCVKTGNTSGQINIAPYDANGNYLGDGILADYVNKLYTAPENIDIGVIIFRNQTSKDNPISTTFSNIQIEQGSAATAYVPYENICPISGRTGVEVYRTGKNICNTPSSADILTDWDLYSSGYNKQIGGLPAGQRFTLQANIIKDLGENISNTRFYLNGKRTSGVFLSTGTPLGVHTTNNEVDDNGTLRLYHNMLGLTSYGAEFNNIQLELGDTATEYEPYTGTTIPITFPSEAGTVYGGYVDLVTGEVLSNWKTTTLDGTQNAYISGTSYRGSTCTDVWFDAGSWGIARNYANGLTDKITQCDTFKLTSYAIWGYPDQYPWCYVLNSTNQIHCCFVNDVVGITSEDTNNQAIAKIKAWLSEHPVDVKYQVSNEKGTSYSLTPQQLKTLRGTNNIWSNANGNIELAYWGH